MAEVNAPAPAAPPLPSAAVSPQNPCETRVGAEAVAEALGGSFTSESSTCPTLRFAEMDTLMLELNHSLLGVSNDLHC